MTEGTPALRHTLQTWLCLTYVTCSTYCVIYYVARRLYTHANTHTHTYMCVYNINSLLTKQTLNVYRRHIVVNLQ